MRGTKRMPYGTKSSPQRQGLNLKYSRRKLEQLLSLNFTDTAQLVTLTYGEGHCPRTRELAVIYQSEFIRRARAACRTDGREMKYINSVAWPVDHASVAHRVVMDYRTEPETLAQMWPYGTAQAAQVDLASGWGGVAALLMSGTVRTGGVKKPCARSWTASMGLRRASEQEGA